MCMYMCLDVHLCTVFLMSEKIEYRETGIHKHLYAAAWLLVSELKFSSRAAKETFVSLQSMDVVLQRFLDFWHFKFLEK